MNRNEKYHGKEALPGEYPSGISRHRDLPAYENRKGRLPKGHFYKENTPEEESLYHELNAYCTSGCTLRLNGRAVRPEQVVRACFREHNTYMRDFVVREGMVEEICFDRVRQ